MSEQHYSELVSRIEQWAQDLGFAQLGITGIDLGEHPAYLQRWLDAGHHGSMDYMARHGTRRSHPDHLIPGTIRVLSLRMDYLVDGTQPLQILEQPEQAYISRYALGRDYHKLIRKRLARLAALIEEACSGGNYRAFVDSAPVLERAIAERAGLGWIAKNTMLINPKAGSWFFLGEIYTDLPLPVSEPQQDKHCGSCRACLDICPTDAFEGPFVLNARKCISYLTIEHEGSIDVALRPLLGNRVFGCDDCQLVCPWNKFAQATSEDDFKPRHQLDNQALLKLFEWDEETWLSRTAGSAIRRIGYQRWLRNLAVALGNAPANADIVAALQSRREDASALVGEHIDWALAQQRGTTGQSPQNALTGE
jgi:epoxyqueuosine reductase